MASGQSAKKKREKFARVHPGLTRSEWAALKKKNGWPKVVPEKLFRELSKGAQ